MNSSKFFNNIQLSINWVQGKMRHYFYNLFIIFVSGAAAVLKLEGDPLQLDQMTQHMKLKNKYMWISNL